MNTDKTAIQRNDNLIYVITGIFGHLGNTIARLLLEAGNEVRGLALPNEKAVPLSGRLSVIRGNVCDKESLLPLFSNPSEKQLVIIHTAGIVTIASHFSQKVYDVNVNGTKNVLDMALAAQRLSSPALKAMGGAVKKFIHVSSVHAIPALKQENALCEISEFNPDKVEGLYAKTKAEATAIVLNYVKKGLPACVVHPSGIIGPNDFGHGHITQLVVDYLKGRLTACVKGGYDFVDVRDVAEGILSCVENGENGSCYILSNKYVSVSELLNGLHEASGRKEIKTVLPMWFAKMTAPLSEVYYKICRQPPLYTAYSLFTLCSNSNFSHEKADKQLGYSTRPLEKTLADTVSFLKDTGRVLFDGVKHHHDVSPVINKRIPH